MPTINIPLRTLAANAVLDSSVIPQMTQPVSTFTDLLLVLNRNVGTASLDTTTTATLTITGEWSGDGGTTWNPGISASVPGGIIFADKAQTIRQETSSIEWQWPVTATHVRGSVTNGSVAVSVSGNVTVS